MPATLEKYYPPEYYSFWRPRVEKPNPIKMLAKMYRLRHFLNDRNLVGLVATRLKGPVPLPGWLKNVNVTPKSRILDVGCGYGNLLNRLRAEGFSSLLGIDPYLPGDEIYDNGVRVLKRRLEEMNGEFDLIMLHHSFEHMPDPLHALVTLSGLLARDGVMLIRIPVASSYAWRRYRTNWVQLDAPRHLYLHTVESMKILANAAGLEPAGIEYDSNAFQFWGSEQYERDIPLNDPLSLSSNAQSPIFSPERLAEFARGATDLNSKGEGDQACFYIRKQLHSRPAVL